MEDYDDELLREGISELEGALVAEPRGLSEEVWYYLHHELRENGYVLVEVDADPMKGTDDPVQKVVIEAMDSGMAFEAGELDGYSGENGDLLGSVGSVVRRLMRGDRQENCWCVMNLWGFKSTTNFLADNSVNPLSRIIGEYYRRSGVTDFVTAYDTDETLLRCWSGYALQPDDGSRGSRLVVPNAYYHVLTVVNVLDEDMVVRLEGLRGEREVTLCKGEVLAVTPEYAAYTVKGGGVYSCFTWPAKAYHTMEPLEELDVTLYRSRAGPYHEVSSTSNMRTVMTGCPHCMRPIGLELVDTSWGGHCESGGDSYAFVSMYYAPDGGKGWWEDGPEVVRSLQRLGRSLGEYCSGIPRILMVAVHSGEGVDEVVMEPFEGCWDRVVPVPRIYRNRWRFTHPRPKPNPADTELTLQPEFASQRCFDSSYSRSFGELTMLAALELVEFDRIAYIHPSVEVRSPKFAGVFTAAKTVPAVAVSGISGRAKLSPRVADVHEYRYMGVMVFEPSVGDAYRVKNIIRECEHPAEVPSSNPAADILTRYWATESLTGVSVLPEVFVGEEADDSDVEFYDELSDGTDGSDVVLPLQDGYYAYRHEWGDDEDTEEKEKGNSRSSRTE